MIIDPPCAHHIPALRTLWQQAFGDPDAFLDSFFSHAFSPSRCRCVINANGVAAALYWFDCTWNGKRLAYLYAVATDQNHRGQGLCRRLTENTHAHLKTQGYHGCILVPAKRSLFQMYEKLGYRTCSYVREFTCPADTPISLQPLSAPEYTALRRQYLPEGGVIQEEETLALLQTQAAFYAGNDCLLVCTREQEKLTVSELLGNTKAAGGIVAALGCGEGKFRVPGNDIPFAMYHSLTDEPAMPGYFGLALD